MPWVGSGVHEEALVASRTNRSVGASTPASDDALGTSMRVAPWYFEYRWTSKPVVVLAGYGKAATMNLHARTRAHTRTRASCTHAYTVTHTHTHTHTHRERERERERERDTHTDSPFFRDLKV